MGEILCGCCKNNIDLGEMRICPLCKEIVASSSKICVNCEMPFGAVFENTGVDIGFYNLRERDPGEIFPWDFIDIGVTKEFLYQEWERALKGEVTPNCRVRCSGCGAMKYKGGVCVESKN